MLHKWEEDCFVEPPTSIQLLNIKEAINENEDRLRISEQLLFKWIDSQPHFPKNYDKNIVRSFLRGSRHDMERAKKFLENHFTAKGLYPEIFSHRSPSSKDIINALETITIVVLPKLTKEGYRVIFFKVKQKDASKINLQLIIKAFFIIYDISLKSPYPAAGDIVIFDNEHATNAHLVKTISPILKTMITILREAYAIRSGGVNFINNPATIDRIISFIRPLLHPKVSKTLVAHQNIKSIYEYYGDILPSDYGGKSKSLAELHKDCLQVLTKNAEWLEAQESVKIIGPKPKDSFLSEDQFGINGCFRKLELD